MKIPKINLLFKILIAIALGILAGQFFPVRLGRIFATFNSIFSQFLGFLIPLIIVGFVAAIADIGHKAGKMLLATAALAYAATTLSGFLSFSVGDTFFPEMISPRTLGEVEEGHDLSPFFTVEIPALMTVMTALVLAFTLGICLAYMKGETFKNLLTEFREIVSRTIAKVIIPSCPSTFSEFFST